MNSEALQLNVGVGSSDSLLYVTDLAVGMVWRICLGNMIRNSIF
jgi:hypothetical protein